MRIITWQEYMKGRDDQYPGWATLDVMRNASHTIEMLNMVLVALAADGVDLEGVHVASGGRPPAINDATANAGHHSRHLTCEAGDLGDLADRRLARWALANTVRLRACGVRAAERPQWTPTWLHLQTVPVPSGHFWYVPSSAPALVAALPGEMAA